jgi:hypothetical protein
LASRIRTLVELDVQPWIADQLIFSLPESLYDAAREVVDSDYRDPPKQLGELRQLRELLQRLHDHGWDNAVPEDKRVFFLAEIDAKIQQLESAISISNKDRNN